MSKPKYKISDMLKILKEVQEQHGNLPVYYASDYDWIMPLGSFKVPKEKTHWENEPDYKFLYFGN